MYNFNATQTPYDHEDLDLDPEYKEFMQEVLNGIVLVQNMTNPNRPYARDLERKDFKYSVLDHKNKPTGEIRIENKIDPDLTNPHILEDMDYFRPAALHFEKHNCYTLLQPNSHPKSEYTRFWAEETRRCRDGYIRESDGEWIPGYYYWYLNYSPIQLAVKTQDSGTGGNVRGERVGSFAKVWDGDYLYFHYIEKGEQLGLFGVVLKTRGRGYSFKGGANPARNFVLFEGSSNFLLAFDEAYLAGDGIWGKTMDNMDWVAKYTPWPRLRIKDSQSEFRVKGGYKKTGESAVYGNTSLLDGIVTRNNENKARGIRGKYAAFEEAGTYPKLLDVWGIAESSFNQGGIVYGYMVAFGTGGSEESDFQALENLFRQPGTYGILGLPNVYDLNVSTEDHVGFFMPEYLNREGCYDKDGNSDIIAALTKIFAARKLKKNNANDPFAIVREKAERPITPVEAMMRKTGTIFPVYLLTEYLTDIRINESKFTASNYVVDLLEKGSDVKWELTQKQPIRKYPHTPTNKHGAVELFTLPETNGKGVVEGHRYIIGVDTYDDDVSTTSSLGCAIVFDLFTDTIVAEYTGRPTFASDFYETVRKLAIFYNARVNYENNKKGLFGHFRNKGAINYLEPTPEYLTQRNLLRSSGYGNTAYGTPATASINAEGLRLQAEWLEKDNPHPIIKEVDGVYETEYMQNFTKVKSVGYIEEAVKWNPDNNFDRVSAMNMVMISRADKENQLAQRTNTRIKRKSNDPFFRKIFRKNGEYSFNAITK